LGPGVGEGVTHLAGGPVGEVSDRIEWFAS